MERINPIPERKNTNPNTPKEIIDLIALPVPENNTAVYIKNPIPKTVKTAPKILLIFITLLFINQRWVFRIKIHLHIFQNSLHKYHIFTPK